MAWAWGVLLARVMYCTSIPGAKGGLSNWALADRQTGQYLGRHAAAYIHHRASAAAGRSNGTA